MPDNPPSMVRYEFYLPNTTFWRGDDATVHPPGSDPHSIGVSQTRDIIRFTINGHEWSLRKLYEVNDMLVPADVAYFLRASGEKLEVSAHAMLHIAQQKLPQVEAETMAEDICWLLGAALGQQVAWNVLRLRTGYDGEDIRRRTVSLPLRNSVNVPIRNEGSGQIRNFLESAYPIYKSDTEWWSITLHWFSLACEASVIEVSGMIYSMLLDRLSTKAIEETKYNFGHLIGSDLAKTLADEKACKKLADEIGKVIKNYEEKWPDYRSATLIDTTKSWNKLPSYPKKVATVCNKFNLPEPPKVVTDARHLLMHKGKLSSDGNLGVYHTEANKAVAHLLFKMLNYPDFVFTPETAKGQ